MESSEGKEKMHWLSRCAIISEMFRMEWYVPFYFPTRISEFPMLMVSAPWLITIWNFLFRSNSTSCMNGTYSPGKSVRCFTCPAGHKCPTTDVSKIVAVKVPFLSSLVDGFWKSWDLVGSSSGSILSSNQLKQAISIPWWVVNSIQV